MRHVKAGQQRPQAGLGRAVQVVPQRQMRAGLLESWWEEAAAFGGGEEEEVVRPDPPGPPAAALLRSNLPLHRHISGQLGHENIGMKGQLVLRCPQIYKKKKRKRLKSGSSGRIRKGTRGV